MTPDYLWRARYVAPDARGAQPVARTAESVVDPASAAAALTPPP